MSWNSVPFTRMIFLKVELLWRLTSSNRSKCLLFGTKRQSDNSNPIDSAVSLKH